MRSPKQRLEVQEGEGSESSKWRHLPQDISESILKLLSLRDYLQFGLVCTSWRTTVANALASKHCLPAPQLPELLVLNRATDSDITYPCFFDLSKQKTINPKRQIFQSSQCCYGSFEGWLFMVDYADVSSSEDWRFSINSPTLSQQELVGIITAAIAGITDSYVLSDRLNNALIDLSNIIDPARNLDHFSPFFLLNPVSGDRIVLPSQLTISPYRNPNEAAFTKIVASSSPNCQDCVIVGLVGTRCRLAVCKLVNKCWTLIEAEETMVFVDIEIIGKMLYVLVDDEGGESTISYDLEDANSPKLNILASLKHKPERRLGIVTARDQGSTEYVTDRDFTYLARDNDSGELLMIRMLIDFAFISDDSTPIRHVLFLNGYVVPPFVKEFRVWKLDKCNHQWLELHHLYGRVLCFRENGSIVISLTSLNDPQEFVKGNCIYFPSSSEDERGSLQFEIGRFCMTDKSMKRFRPIDSSAADQSSMESVSYWFMPSIF